MSDKSGRGNSVALEEEETSWYKTDPACVAHWNRAGGPDFPLTNY